MAGGRVVPPLAPNGMTVSLRFWTLIFSIPLWVVEARAQWQALDGFMVQQVEAGWWIPQDRLLVLAYLEQSGSPVAREEAFAIAGLSHQAAKALSEASVWLDLVRHANRRGAAGDGAGSEFRVSNGSWTGSMRFRNPGKWALRWDAGNARPSGYLLVQGSHRRWRGIVGGHRLGWGHRLLVEEGALFSGLDAPSFALPVHYECAPAWGALESVPRHGVALRSNGARKGVLSIHDAGRDVALALRSRWGSTGYAARWQAEKEAVSAVVWKEGYSGNRHWLAEGGRLENGWGVKGTCQWMPSREEEGRIQFEARWHADEARWGIRSSAGGEWSHLNGRLRMRWLINWSNSDAPDPLWVKWRFVAGSGHAGEVHWRTTLSQREGGDHLRRLEWRWAWKSEAYASRVVWVPHWDQGLSGCVMWFLSTRAGQWKYRQSIALWNMPNGRRAYVSEPALGGTAYRMLSGTGHRWVASLERKGAKGLAVNVRVAFSNQPAVLAEGATMLTLTYAQREFQCAVSLNM